MRLFAPVLRFPKLTLLLIAAGALVLARAAQTLELETDMRNWIPAGHPDVQYDDYVRDVFEVLDTVVLGVERLAPGGVYTPEVLGLIADLSAEVEAIDGVLQGEVISIATADNIIGTEAGLEVAPFMDGVPDSPEAIAALRAAVRANPMYAGRLVSEDEQAAMIVAKVTDAMNREALYGAVRDRVDAWPLPPETRLVIGGRIALEGAIAELIVAELKRIAPLSMGCMTLMLALVMRSVRGVVLPLLVVVLAVFTAYGTMGLSGVKFYSMSTMIVTLLVAMGVADGIHMINAYTHHVMEDPDADRPTVVRRMLEEMSVPVVMTSLTTAAGFFALGFAPVLPIKAFGVFTAVGILGAMVFSLTLIPAGLLLLPLHVPRAYRPRGDGVDAGVTHRLLAGFSRLVAERPRRVLAVAAVVVAGGVMQATRLQVDSSLTGNINQDNPAVVANEYLNAHFDGTTDLALVFDGGAGDAVKDPALLRDIDALQAYAERLPLVGGSTSVVEYLKRMHQVMNADDPAWYRVPESRDLAAQYLFLYSLSGDPDDFDDVVDYDYRQARVQLHLRSDHSSRVIPIIRTMHAYLDEQLPPARRPRFAGRAHNAKVMQELVISGQFITLAISLVVVYLLAALMFRSALGGLIVSTPVLIATVLNFGMMSQAGIALGVGNSTLAAIGIGIGIDYAIHYLARFRRMMARGADFPAAAHATTVTTGRAILFNALVVAAGYLVNLASRFPPTVTLGAIVSFNMLTSFLAAMLIIPILLTRYRPRFLSRARPTAPAAAPLVKT